jgi:hypothetical protein
VRHRSNILDLQHLDPEALNGANGRLATGTWTLDADLGLFEAVCHRLTAGILSDELSGLGGAFARSAETHLARAGPTNDVANVITDGNDRVVEG